MLTYLLNNEIDEQQYLIEYNSKNTKRFRKF